LLGAELAIKFRVSLPSRALLALLLPALFGFLSEALLSQVRLVIRHRMDYSPAATVGWKHSTPR
jgi:hypothetical protein